MHITWMSTSDDNIVIFIESEHAIKTDFPNAHSWSYCANIFIVNLKKIIVSYTYAYI